MDPLAEKHYSSIQRLKPLLQSVSRAPLEESFKTDISLLVTECLVRRSRFAPRAAKPPKKRCELRRWMMR